MKTLRIGFLPSALFCLLLIGCESPIVFSVPQPEGGRAREQFQPAYYGVYYCSEDSAYLRITECCLVKTKEYEFTMHRDSLAKESGVQLNEHSLYVEELNQTIPIEFLDEEKQIIHGALRLSDTLFSIGPREVLKSYRGHLVLNRQLEEGYWDVSLLSQNRDGSLSFFRTVLPEDLSKLEEITPVRDISTSDRQVKYQIAPSRRAFRQLLKTKLIFEGCSRFEKVGSEEWEE